MTPRLVERVALTRGWFAGSLAIAIRWGAGFVACGRNDCESSSRVHLVPRNVNDLVFVPLARHNKARHPNVREKASVCPRVATADCEELPLDSGPGHQEDLNYFVTKR